MTEGSNAAEDSPSAEALPVQPPMSAVSFIDAAATILSQAGGPLNYRDLTTNALEQGLITSAGLTPAATMNAQIGIDIARRQSRGEPPRFVRLGHGSVGLAPQHSTGLQAQIEAQNQQVRRALATQLHSMPPADFEALIARLLGELGFTQVAMTPYSHDGGIDVRGILVVGDVIRIRMAVQVKRWTRNVQTPSVQQLRGTLGSNEQGLLVTTSDFSSGARKEAQRADAGPVALMSGGQLVALLAEHQIGVKRFTPWLLQLAPLDEES